MKSKRGFSSLVVAALVGWAACATAMAVTEKTAGTPSEVRSVANVFPIAQAAFASRF